LQQENSRYEFEFDIKLRVPNKLLLQASTVNSGGPEFLFKSLNGDIMIRKN
jgi:hypothetical protein